MSDFNAPVNQAGSQKSTSRLATAALICAVIGLSPLLLLIGFPLPIAIGILASPLGLILGILALLPRTPKPSRSKSRAITAIIISLFTATICILFICFFLPSLGRAHELANRNVCAAHMRGIALALQNYASLNNEYPPDFGPLLLDGSITRASVLCRSSGNPRVPDTDLTQAAAHIMQYSSFIYVRPNQGEKPPPDAILLYEPLHNHQGEGINIAFADGHVEFFDADEARSLLEKQGLKVVE